jgi:hypothetical protein
MEVRGSEILLIRRSPGSTSNCFRSAGRLMSIEQVAEKEFEALVPIPLRARLSHGSNREELIAKRI